MLNLGTVRPGSTLYIPFDTFAAATGAPITITNFAVGDIKIFKNGGTTERASTNGFTLLDTDGIDFDGITGIQGFSVDLSDNSTADFYQAGADYFVVVSTITVDSQTVSFIAAKFRIGYSGAILDTTIASLSSQTSFTLSTGPAEDDALNGMWAVIHDQASGVQMAKVLISDYTGSSKTVTLAAGATFTAAAGDNFSVVGMSTLQTEITAIKAITDALGATAAARLALTMGSSPTGTVTNAGFTPTSTEFEAGDITEATADHYVGRVVLFTSGAMLGQAAAITDYALSGGRGHFTVSELTEAPPNGVTFIII